MTRLFALSATAPVVALAAMLAAPAMAQDNGGDRVNTVIIYGDDECPMSDDNTITVCARLDESERYRIPERLRESGSPQNEAWASRAQSLEAVGEFGPLTCSPVGIGADLGCTVEMIEAAYAERAQSSDVRFGSMIADVRDERLEGIDDDAAATQARVEELERIELERRARAQAALLPGEDEEALPQVVDPSRIPATPPPTDTPVGD